MEVLLVEIYPLKKWNFSSRAFYSVRSSIKYGRKIFRKTNISNPLMRTQTFFAYALNRWHPYTSEQSSWWETSISFYWKASGTLF